MKRNIVILLFVVNFFSCRPTSPFIDDGFNEAEQTASETDETASIVVLPDTQYYTAIKYGGTMQMFQNQIDWILKNYQKEKVAYIIHLGDVTDHDTPVEWKRARDVMYKLDATGVPYGLAVGNHDQTPGGKPSAGRDNTLYTKYFGKSHFGKKPWYGGALGNNNNMDAHFDVFSANGEKYLVMYIPFNDPGYEKGYNAKYDKKVLGWADKVLADSSHRKAIIVSHSALRRPEGSSSNYKPGDGNNRKPGKFTEQGWNVYKMARNHRNVFLMLGGHISGEGYRKDTHNGGVIKTYLQDYQFRRNPPYNHKKYRNGGGGTMRLMRLNKTKQTLSVITFTPQRNGTVKRERDGDSEFTHSLYK